jgi:hypothetical protein
MNALAETDPFTSTVEFSKERKAEILLSIAEQLDSLGPADGLNILPSKFYHNIKHPKEGLFHHGIPEFAYHLFHSYNENVGVKWFYQVTNKERVLAVLMLREIILSGDI